MPFGGTIYGWHNGDSWFGVGDFTVAKDVMHATVTDPNTGFTDLGDIWLGTEEGTFDFGKGKQDRADDGLRNRTPERPRRRSGSFSRERDRLFRSRNRPLPARVGTLQLAGPVWPGVALPTTIEPGLNDGLFWIGQYVGTICGVKTIR